MKRSLHLALGLLAFVTAGCSVGHHHRYDGKRYRMTSDNIEHHQNAMKEVGDISQLLRSFPKTKAPNSYDRTRVRKAMKAKGDTFEPPEILAIDLTPLEECCSTLTKHERTSPKPSGFTSAGKLLRRDMRRVCGRLTDYRKAIAKWTSAIAAMRANEVKRQANEVKRNEQRRLKAAEAEQRRQEKEAKREQRLAESMNPESCAKPTHARSCKSVFAYLRAFPEGPHAEKAKAAKQAGAAKLKVLRIAEQRKKQKEADARRKRAVKELKCFRSEQRKSGCAFKRGTYRTNCKCGAVIRCCRKLGRPRAPDCFSCL
jgi:hypothetical protein